MDFRQFVTQPGKKVILTDQVSAMNRFIRGMAKQGVAIYGVKVVKPVQVATELFYAGKVFRQESGEECLISSKRQVMRLFLCMKRMKANGGLSLVHEKSITISTANEILSSMNQLRFNNPSTALQECPTDKLRDLTALMDQYEAELVAHGEMDEKMLYERAIDILENISASHEDPRSFLKRMMPDYASSRVGTFFGEQLTSLEQKFLEQYIGLLSLQPEKLMVLPQNPPVYSFYSAYGIEKEVQNVIGQIGNEQYGEVAIVYPSAEYENMLRAELGSAGIPFSFPRGFSAAGTEFVSLLLEILDFAERGFRDDDLYALLDNGALRIPFCRKILQKYISSGIGYGRERFISFFEQDITVPDENSSAFRDFLYGLANCFTEGKSCGDIFRELIRVVKSHTSSHDVHRSGVLDQLVEYASVLDLLGVIEWKESIAQIRTFLLGVKCSSAESADAVLILPYGHIEAIDRRILFVLGLSSENVESIPLESPVLSDRELETLCQEKQGLRLAGHRNTRNRDAFLKTLELTAAERIVVSYADYDCCRLLNNSRSMLFQQLLAKAGKKDADVITISYHPARGPRQIQAPVKAATISPEEQAAIKKLTEIFSASSLQNLIRCPRSYYFDKILHLPQTEFAEKSADHWLQANVKGNVFHEVMEQYVQSAVIDQGETGFQAGIFEGAFRRVLEETIRQYPYPSEDIRDQEIEEMRDALVRYIPNLHSELNASPGRKVVGCEVNFTDAVYSGPASIGFNGYVDRLDGLVKDGILTLFIIDYKTGNREKKIKEIKGNKQIQHYVYALGVLKWAEDHRTELSDLFGSAEIKEVQLSEKMKYVFPFEEDAEKEIETTIPTNNSNFRFPQEVDDVLKDIILPLQQGKMSAALAAIDTRTAKCKQDDKRLCEYCSYKNVCGR